VPRMADCHTTVAADAAAASAANRTRAGIVPAVSDREFRANVELVALRRE